MDNFWAYCVCLFWAAAYLAIGLVVTAASGVLTFKQSDTTSQRVPAALYPTAKIANVTTDLSGTVVNAPAGRMIMDIVIPNIIP